VPITLVGTLSGTVAAGFLGISIDGIGRLTTLTSAILDNLQAVVPQAIGRGEYARLRANLLRVLAVLALAGVGFYGLVALFSPIAVPLLLGHESAGATPVVVTLCLYGAVVTVGGVFGPLYRALDRVRSTLLVKVVVGLALLLPGVLLIEQYGAVGGAWLVDGLYLLSVAGTMLVTLPVLNARANAQTTKSGPSS
jgi:O-antigen/teichoic acid export membrane protein